MRSLGKERDELNIVNDQYCTPTYVPHLARAVRTLLDTEAYGIYHVTNCGSTNWYQFAEEIFKIAGLNVKLNPISTAEFGAPAPRPEYSVLDTQKFSKLNGGALPNWKDALAEYFQLASVDVKESLVG